ncbi:MAG: rhodanese-like domain-containing protein [Succinivibrio sp.]|nr:rhodanese-like domain-containing protein [Succinivibrio sp.]
MSSMVWAGSVLAGSLTLAQESSSQTNHCFNSITKHQALEMMQKDDGHVIVDVRKDWEYEMGHIPNAVLIPNESIKDSRPSQLADLDQVILIYCLSGRRSKQAAAKLVALGYTHVYEFGGINTWEGVLVSGEAQ